MKKQILALALGVAAFAAKAQTTDTVILGSGYANQVWYSLPNDEQGTQPKNNWDLGFRTSGSMGSSILINGTGSGAIWLYPKADKAGWTTADTSGLSTWPKLYNEETVWNGALGRYTDPGNPYDLGWGVYDIGTHIVSGDSLYIIKTQAGAYRKLLINKLSSGTYTFTYANLDGTDSTTSSLSKTAYADKNYGYFSLDTKTAIDREPATTDWDLVFGQYTTADYASMGIPGYTVTGILVNDTLKIAHTKVDPATRAGYKAYATLTFSGDINGIGYNWKTYNSSTSSYVLNDSSVYFVRRNNGDIWKLILTGFSSATGSTIFSKELIYTTTAINEITKGNTTLAISPNPARNGQNISAVYAFDKAVKSANLTVYDLMGRVVITTSLDANIGLHTYTFATDRLSPGTYIVSIAADTEQTQQKVIVQ